MPITYIEINTINATKYIRGELISDSTAIGNYSNNSWTITNENAQYLSNGKFVPCPNPFKKELSSSILLTTGADSSFLVQNIYDIAGNVYEWTLEKTSDNSSPCAIRGGNYYYSSGSRTPAAHRDGIDTFNYNDDVGFRVALW